MPLWGKTGGKIKRAIVLCALSKVVTAALKGQQISCLGIKMVTPRLQQSPAF